MKPSAAAQVLITIIPIVGIVMGSVVIFFYLLWDHKQKILLIEKGEWKRRPFDYYAFSLFTGLVLVGVGAALSFLFYAKEGLDYSLLGGVIPFSIGISLLLFFLIGNKRNNENQQS